VGDVSADLSARCTAAAAALADYRAGGEMDMMDRALWAGRLAAELAALLAGVAEDDATADSARLAEVRALLAAFDWERGDRQYALEDIARIAEGSAL
jgi:hypothetical protein